MRIAKFEHDLIHERTMDGLKAARARGRVGGRKPKLDAGQQRTLKKMYAAVGADGKRQHIVDEIASALGIHRTTAYDYLRQAS